MMTTTKTEIVKVFGGGWEAWVDGLYFGVFPTKKSATVFVKALELANSVPNFAPVR